MGFWSARLNILVTQSVSYVFQLLRIFILQTENKNTHTSLCFVVDSIPFGKIKPSFTIKSHFSRAIFKATRPRKGKRTRLHDTVAEIIRHNESISHPYKNYQQRQLSNYVRKLQITPVQQEWPPYFGLTFRYLFMLS